MAKRTVIHVGLPKTGTTFLQTTMWAHRDELAERGFLYPGHERMNHYELSRSVGGQPGPRGISHEVRRELVDAVRTWEGTAVLTHEFLSQATTAQAARLVDELGPTDLTVVVTGRDLVRQVPAVWQEALKMGRSDDLGTFVDWLLEPGHRDAVREAHGSEAVVGTPERRPWGWSTQDLPAVLSRWADAVGHDHVRLVTVPPPAAPRVLLWERWCEVAGLDDTGVDHGLAFGNESLGATQARLLTLVARGLSDDFGGLPVRHRWLRQYLGHEVLVPQGGAKIGLAPRHLDELRPLARRMVEEVSSGAYTVVGDLEELLGSEQSPTAVDPDAVSDTEALAVAVRAIETMVVDVRELSTAPPPTPQPPTAAPRPRLVELASRARGRLRRRLDAGTPR